MNTIRFDLTGLTFILTYLTYKKQSIEIKLPENPKTNDTNTTGCVAQAVLSQSTDLLNTPAILDLNGHSGSQDLVLCHFRKEEQRKKKAWN